MTYTYTYEPSKKEIIERLFKNGHITFNEMWTLLLDNPDVRYIPMPSQVPPIQDLWTPSLGPYVTTMTNDKDSQ